MSEIETTISDINLFINQLQKDMPEVFSKTKQENLPFNDKLLYKGNLYQTKAVPTENPEVSVTIENDVMTVFVDGENKFSPSTLLEQWLKETARKEIPEKAKRWAEKMGVEFNRAAIKDQKTLWGSCSSKKNLNFCWRLIKAPEIVLDYIIIHELAHLIHLNHSADFWAEVAKWSPDYKNHRQWLNRHKRDILERTEVRVIPKEEIPLDNPQ
jgi:predicted metal-dependent hydrolase